MNPKYESDFFDFEKFRLFINRILPSEMYIEIAKPKPHNQLHHYYPWILDGKTTSNESLDIILSKPSNIPILGDLMDSDRKIGTIYHRRGILNDDSECAPFETIQVKIPVNLGKYSQTPIPGFSIKVHVVHEEWTGGVIDSPRYHERFLNVGWKLNPELIRIISPQEILTDSVVKNFTSGYIQK